MSENVGAVLERSARLFAGREAVVDDEPRPKSGAGKLLKRELRKPYWEGRERQVS